MLRFECGLIERQTIAYFCVKFVFMVRKFAVVFILINLFFFPTYGQFLQTRLQLQSGLSIPTGTFSGDRLPESSFAQTGLHTSVLIDIKIWENWDLTLQSGLLLHSIDVGSLGREKVAADAFLEDVIIRSDPFRIIPVMAGPQFTIGEFERFSVQAQAQIGVFFSRTPYQLYKPTYFLVGPPYYEVTSASDVSFAYGAGLSISYATRSCVSVNLGASWLHSEPVYGFISAGVLRNERRPVNLINLALGITIPLFTPKS